MEAFEDPIAAKRRMLRELRRLRTETERTQKDVAEAMDWSPSKVIRIEAGAVTASTTDLRALLTYYGVTGPDAVAELLATAKAARKSSQWSDYKDVIGVPVQAYFGYESSASVIRQYQGVLVPGLLQTEAYSRAVLRDVYGLAAEKVDRHVEMRLARQELLERDHPPRLHFILGEAAVRCQVGSAPVMLRQLDRLEELGSRDRVSIQVLPFALGGHLGMEGPFVVMDFPGVDDVPVVYLEGREHQLVRDDQEAVGHYMDIFQGLEGRATTPDALAKALAASRRSMESTRSGGAATHR
jgi:transcriptional regulator with XRE-family HTH domain